MLKQSRQRISEIDALRGMAIILMVIFHIIVDLTDFFGYSFSYLSGFWYYEGKAAAVLFMFLAGISATLNPAALFHGLRLLGWGMVLTIVTYFYAPAVYIRFGILHFLGASLIIWALLKNQKPGTLLFLAASTMMLGRYTAELTAGTELLLPLGVMPPDFASMDYYPLLPWYGVFLLGTVTGKTLYASKNSLCPQLRLPQPLTWLGRHSLLIYLIHQPVLLALFYTLH